MTALLKPNESFEMTKLKIEIPKPISEKLDKYMSYAGFKHQDDAITKALEYVMEKDKGFRDYCSAI